MKCDVCANESEEVLVVTGYSLGRSHLDHLVYCATCSQLNRHEVVSVLLARLERPKRTRPATGAPELLEGQLALFDEQEFSEKSNA